jgi:hypothetical protein
MLPPTFNAATTITSSDAYAEVSGYRGCLAAALPVSE